MYAAPKLIEHGLIVARTLGTSISTQELSNKAPETSAEVSDADGN